jgi:hypothetical protein
MFEDEIFLEYLHKYGLSQQSLLLQKEALFCLSNLIRNSEVTVV